VEFDEIDITDKVKRIIKLFVPVLLSLGVLCAAGLWLYQKSNKQLVLYDAKVNGKLVQARCRAEGSVVEVKVEDGAAVKAGQAIAKIEVKVTEEQLKQLQQNVVLAEENLARLQEGVVVSRPVYHSSGGYNAAAADKLAKMEELYRMGAISAAERDAAAAAVGSGGGGEVSYETVVQQSSPEVIQNGERRLQQARAALEKVKKNSQATEVIAPVAGNAFLQELEAGKAVKSGEVLALIGNAENLWVEAIVSESQRQQLYVGQMAKCKINGRWIEGNITDITPLVQAKEGYGELLSEEEKKLSVVYVSLSEQQTEGIHPGQAAELTVSLT